MHARGLNAPSRPFCRALILWLLQATAASLGADLDPGKLPPPASRQVDFRRDIHPLLSARCFKCHGGHDAKSGYRLDHRAEILGETNGLPLALPGKSAASRLIHLVSGALADKVMPPEGKRLTAEEVGLLRAWIDQGLPWDDELLPPPTATSAHWAFQPVQRPKVPGVKNQAWVRSPIDAFVLAELEPRGLVPAPEASPWRLLRRLSLDLTGLPPEPEEVQAFASDPSPDAYEKLVERLLASPHYGERWGRHWLDVARWADSEGYESNRLRPYAWRYRDYVTKSFNEDKPYDRFLREQIAGDEILPYSDDNLIATGFLAAARVSGNEQDKAAQRNDILVDIVNAAGSAILGLTLGCAQCHNHKFDPITQRDYYRFQGFFVRGQPGDLLLRDEGLWKAYEAAKPPEYDTALKLRQQILDRARKKLEEKGRELGTKKEVSTKEIEEAVSEDDKPLLKDLQKKIESLTKQLPDKPQTWGFYSPATSPTRVEMLPFKGDFPLPYAPEELQRARPAILVRGNVHRRGPELAEGWPEVLGELPRGRPDENAVKGPRWMLSDWLSSRENPLTARVWANRLWHYHFGRGIVETPGDFGLKGAPPTHPALLDWLAAELMDSGWSTKRIHRLIVLSSTYRQSSKSQPDNARIDPEDKYLWRWPPHRLEAEAIHDAILLASGELDQAIGGTEGAPREKDGAELRRALYLLQKRDNFPPVEALFDGPPATESCARRHVSTVALQPLYLLNSEFLLKRGKAFTGRVLARAGDALEGQIKEAFLIALGRQPEKEEISEANRFFQSSLEPHEALFHFCHALLNLNEFVYLE